MKNAKKEVKKKDLDKFVDKVLKYKPKPKQPEKSKDNQSKESSKK